MIFSFESLPSWERGLKSIPNVPYPVLEMSLPSWERGLKSSVLAMVFEPSSVAPLVGARIEILKDGMCLILQPVAPLVGARIEILAPSFFDTPDTVAPLVGARIEMPYISC